MTGPILKIENLKLSFEDTHVLKGIDLEINQGDVLAILGPSGSGKSTLLRCINLLEQPSSGDILYKANSILNKKDDDQNALRRHIGMVFQGFNLFPHLSVIKNIMLPQVKVLKKSEQEARNFALELLSNVGLKDRANFYPSQLSGGQQQRVAIARALSLEPDVLLFDEPTSALDPMLVREVLAVMSDLSKHGMTMVIVTHDIEFAYRAANRIVFLDKGNIVEQGSSEQVIKFPKEQDTKKFLGIE